MDDLDVFARLLTALRPWLAQLVVVGGWAHRLHCFHRLAKVPNHRPLATRDTEVDLELFIPNATSFIVQKLLIHSGRHNDKKAQDVLYIHDTLELFGGSLGELRRLWVEEVRPSMAPKWVARAETLAHELFFEVTDTIRDAARIPQDRRLAAEDVRRACAYGFGEILGKEPIS